MISWRMTLLRLIEVLCELFLRGSNLLYEWIFDSALYYLWAYHGTIEIEGS